MKNIWNFNCLQNRIVTHKDTDFPHEIDPLILFLDPVLSSSYFHSIMLQDDQFTYFIGLNATDERNRYSLMKFFVKRLPRNRSIS